MKKGILQAGVLAVSFVLMACDNGMKFDLPQTSDNFEQNVTYNNKVDIVWMIDSSSSMSQHQARLNDQIPTLVSTLNALKMDYHMAVVTSSMGGTAEQQTGGKFVGSPKYVTRSTPNLVNVLKARMLVGESGSNNERGLESVETALSAGYLNTEGRGFFRDEALLVVIALSDEDDKSKSTSDAAATYYKNFFDSIKRPWVDGTRSWMFSFIGVLNLSSQCTTFNDYAEPGLAFIKLADASGGVKTSICTNNLSSAVSGIRARIFQILTDFKLSKKPDPATIVVKINGQVVPQSSTNGWDYIEDLNIIRFYGSAVPAADASIKVDFKPKEAN
ncbi:hypothetical protein D3C87_299580 [compost metagenome]